MVHVGVLLYASSTMRVDLAGRFVAMRWMARMAQELQCNPALWSSTNLVHVPATVMKELSSWTELVLANKPVPIPTYTESKASLLICVDASAWGWAAVCVDLTTGQTQIHRQRWPPGSAVSSSVITESTGIFAAVCRFVAPSFGGTVTVLTDHAPFAAAHAEAMQRLGHTTTCSGV